MNVGIWIVLLLAVVQGLTEFFPVSSSGHLVILESLFGMRGAGNTLGVVFEVAVHLGTLGAVVIFYRRRILGLLRSVIRSIAPGAAGRGAYRADLGYIGLVILGSVPAGVVGVAFNDRIEAAFNEPVLTSLCLVATGIYLFASRRRAGAGRITWRTALAVGAAQAVAVLPGCSRSGWTITTALLLGLGFAEAAEFSFMLLIPAVLGATALEIVKEPAALAAAGAVPLVVGVVASFLAGWLALRLLIGILNRGAFHRFAYYLIPVGVTASLLFLLRP